jgi:two-component system phosphate regulon response regulator PhoB
VTKQDRLILIVEDDKPLRDALTLKLVSRGFRTLSAKNGHEGLAIAVDEKPDLILLDIVMPVMDGLTMAAELRKDPWGKDAEIIVLSNNSDNDKIARAVGSGVYEYIIKSDRTLEEVANEVESRLDALGV